MCFSYLYRRRHTLPPALSCCLYGIQHCGNYVLFISVQKTPHSSSCSELLPFELALTWNLNQELELMV